MIDNTAPNQGGQGTFHGPVTFNYGTSNPNRSALHQLRAPVGDFVGREQEIAELVAALTGGGVAGIRGLGGIGKTELAYTVAHRLCEHFPDVQIVVELLGATEPVSPEQALQQAIRAFEPVAKLPDDLPALIGLYQSCLHGKRALILADDAKDAAQVRPLLPPPGCALIITSRQRFHIGTMAEWNLGTLATEEAERLVLDICPRIGVHASDMATLCGNFPLALRVSATFLRQRTRRPVSQYIDQLRSEHERLTQLRDPNDPEIDVAASFNLSYAILPEPMQHALAQLAVFVGTFDTADGLTIHPASAIPLVCGSSVPPA